MISRSGSETSLVNIVHRLAFLLKFNLIIHQFYAYINAFTLVHLSAFEFTSIDLSLVLFLLTKGTGVPENCVFKLVLIKFSKNKIKLKRRHLVRTLVLFIRINTLD